MAVMIYQTDDGRTPGLEYLPCGGEVTPRAGMAMVQAEGMLRAATGAELPTYLCMTERVNPCQAGELIPVVRVAPDIVCETETPAGFSAVPGGRVQLSADGMNLTAEADGAAEVVYTDSTVTRFRFVQPAAPTPTTIENQE